MDLCSTQQQAGELNVGMGHNGVYCLTKVMDIDYADWHHPLLILGSLVAET